MSTRPKVHALGAAQPRTGPRRKGPPAQNRAGDPHRAAPALMFRRIKAGLGGGDGFSCEGVAGGAWPTAPRPRGSYFFLGFGGSVATYSCALRTHVAASWSPSLGGSAR